MQCKMYLFEVLYTYILYKYCDKIVILYSPHYQVHNICLSTGWHLMTKKFI